MTNHEIFRNEQYDVYNFNSFLCHWLCLIEVYKNRKMYYSGARPLGGKIKGKNLSCKINSIHHLFKNQSSISLKFLTYKINEINEN